jgi:hypothetical protein
VPKRRSRPQPKLLNWFRNSETILVARLISLGGLITTFVGSLDLSPIWDLFKSGTDFTPKQLFWMGIGILGAGVAVEFARRRPESTDPV